VNRFDHAPDAARPAVPPPTTTVRVRTHSTVAGPDLPVTDASTIEVDGRPFAGEPVGPGEHRVVVSAARVADPAALVAPAR
jgi:hypothetical protein